MAYADKSALKAAVQDEVLRPDFDYDELIARAEAAINPKLVRVRDNENSGLRFVLDGDADSNWLLENAPNVYFNATVAEAYLKERNNDEASLWWERTIGAIDDLIYENTRDTSARLSVDSDLFRLSQLGWKSGYLTTDDTTSSGSSSSSEDPDAFILD